MVEWLTVGSIFHTWLGPSFGGFQDSNKANNWRLMSFWVGLRGTKDRLEKYFFSSKIWWSKFGGNKLTKWGKSIVLSNVNYFGKSCILIQKYSISSSITSKWAITLILYHFEVLMRATQPPNMKVKLHLEVVEPDFIFSELQLNLFGVFITKGYLIDFPHFVSLFSPNFDHQIFELKKYFPKRSFVPRSATQKLISL